MYLRVSVTDRCNLRCTYCLPEDARFAPSRTTPDELDRLMAAVCASAQVTKIRLTGGEPTICPSLLQHIRTAAWLVPTVGMTTNGVALERLLPDVRDAGLTRLNISLDAADAVGFHRSARQDHFAAVLGAIRAAKRIGFAPLKLNAVATVDTDPVALVRLAVTEGVHLRFIELMDIGIAHADWNERHVAADILRDRLTIDGIAIAEATDRDEPTSRVWTVDGVDPTATTIGFITTVTDPFCSTCDRIRLTSQGRLHTCLFDERGTDLLPLLRDGDLVNLDAAIRRAIGAKAPPPRFQRTGMMAGIGG
jgi:GTP 3',8-cyclase